MLYSELKFIIVCKKVMINILFTVKVFLTYKIWLEDFHSIIAINRALCRQTIIKCS